MGKGAAKGALEGAKDGLIYMRARYYSPEMKRFINADLVAGAISDAITLNRFAYANGNPVSFVDPFGLSVWSWIKDKYHKAKDWMTDTYNQGKEWIYQTRQKVNEWIVDTYNDAKETIYQAYSEAKEWVIDTYAEAKEWVTNTYHDAKESIIDTYHNTKEALYRAGTWADQNIIQPLGEAITDAGNQIKDSCYAFGQAISRNVGIQVKCRKRGQIEPQLLLFCDS